MGLVGNTYFHVEGGGDQQSGRMATGLCPTSKEFATLPPRFKPEIIQKINDEGLWSEFIPCYKKLVTTAPGFASVVPFLVASLILHHDWIENNLSKRHPYRSSSF